MTNVTFLIQGGLIGCLSKIAIEQFTLDKKIVAEIIVLNRDKTFRDVIESLRDKHVIILEMLVDYKGLVRLQYIAKSVRLVTGKPLPYNLIKDKRLKDVLVLGNTSFIDKLLDVTSFDIPTFFILMDMVLKKNIDKLALSIFYGFRYRYLEGEELELKTVVDELDNLRCAGEVTMTVLNNLEKHKIKKEKE